MSEIEDGRAFQAMQVIAFRLGGGASLAAHAGKAGARGDVNASPEPVSNVMVSSAEDVATAGLLYVTYEYPVAAGGIALVLLLLVIGLLMLARRMIKRAVGKVEGLFDGPDEGPPIG